MASTLAVVLFVVGRPVLVYRGGGGGSSGGDPPQLLDNLLTLKQRLKEAQGRLEAVRQEDSKPPVTTDPEIGDRVRVRRDVAKPRFDWGEGVSHESVGRLTWFSGERCRVDYPRHPEWHGMLNEMERVAQGRSLPRIGDRVRVRRSVNDPAYGWGRVNHDSEGEVVSLGFDPERGDAETCVVRFEGHANWTGLLSEMSLLTPRDAKPTAAPSDAPQLPRLPFAMPRAAEAEAAWPMSVHAGRVLGATAMAVSGSLGPAPQEAPIAGNSKLRLAVALRRALRRTLGLLLVLSCFCWCLGLMLGLGAALVDRPLSSLLDDALDTALRLRRGLAHTARTQEQPAAAAGVPPMLRGVLLLPLRVPSVGLSALCLYVLCSMIPHILDELRHGFEIGFRQLRAANSAASSARQDALLAQVTRILRLSTGVMHAARATAIAIGGLVLLGGYFEGA